MKPDLMREVLEIVAGRGEVVPRREHLEELLDVIATRDRAIRDLLAGRMEPAKAPRAS